MRITLKKLEKAKACSRERKRFARLFPNGCELNEKNLQKWGRQKHRCSAEGDLHWFVKHVLGWDNDVFWEFVIDPAWHEEQKCLLGRAAKFFFKGLAKRKRRKK